MVQITVKKFATAVTLRIRNLAGRSESRSTQQNVTVRNKPQQNFETVRSGTGSKFLNFSVILIAAILKIGLWPFIFYRLNVNSLIMTLGRSLNNMISLNESPGDILNHKL